MTRRRGHDDNEIISNKEIILNRMTVEELQEEVARKIAKKYDDAERQLLRLTEIIKRYEIPKECFTDNDLKHQKKIEEILMEMIKIINAKIPKGR